MDILTILFIVIAALVGAVITYFIIGKKTKEQAPSVTAGSEEDVRTQKEEEIKNEYKSLLSDAQSRINQLDAQLKECLNGHLDDTAQKQLDEVDELKKKIKQLEDEIEENEDDLMAYKKKLKKKDEEYDTLQCQLDKEIKEGKTIKEDLENLRSELDDKKGELKLKMESLLFVQEIVSARPVNDADLKELYDKVDKVTDFVGEELKESIKNLFPLDDKREIFGDDLKRWAITTKKSWIQNKTSIAFVGEFSAGKTSIVNRILSRDNPDVPLLPVSTKATTAIPTYISGGINTRYSFVTPDNKMKGISEETFKRVNKEVLDEIKGISSLIQYFVMSYKNENLNNLSILDTPGFSSNDKEDAQRTIEVINECDALFWVFDVNAGTVNHSSIDLIKKNLKKPLYVVINKVDTKAKTEVDKVEQLIRKTLADEGVHVEEFIRFSAKAPLSDIMKPIASVPKDSEQKSYIRELLSFVKKHREELCADVRKVGVKQTNLFQKCDELECKYKEAIGKLLENCNQAAEIPHFETHWFGKDRYEMSDSEYNNLVGALDTICKQNVAELDDLFKKQMNTQREAQKAYNDYRDKREKQRKIEECEEQLEKVVKPFNEQ